LAAEDSRAPSVPEAVARVGRGRVRYVKNEKNLGIDGNFNRCVDLAETDFVTVLHADDELMPNYTATMLRALERYPQRTMIGSPHLEDVHCGRRERRRVVDVVRAAGELAEVGVPTPGAGHRGIGGGCVAELVLPEEPC